MSDTPERIWLGPDYMPDHSQHFGPQVQYIRADIHRAELEAVREACALEMERLFRKVSAADIRALDIDEILKEARK